MEYKYYLPKNFDKLSFDDLTFDQFEDMDEAARKLFEKDYINLAWQKASKEMQDKAKKFVKKYLRKEDVAKEFIWESLSDERQKEIKEEVIGSRRQRRNAEAANKISKAFKNFKTKKQKEGDIKKEKLNKLIQEGHNIREFLEHGEDKSEVFFDFKEPVPGCKYNIGKAKGFIAIPMQQKDFRLFLSDLEKYSYYVIEQLYDQINKTLDVDVQAVCLMQKEENTQQRTDHSGWHNIHSRNGIPSTCDSIRSKTEAKLLLPKSKSGMSFKEGILMKITYRADHTRTKKEKRTKNKGGKWIDHMSIPCFQNRERDLKKLRNYSFKNKDSYIFNFTNFDDLCFLRNIILVKFMCEIKNNKLLPLIEPTHIDEFYPYLPLIKYPNKRFNEEAQNLFNKYSHYIKANNFPYEYILECKKFAEMLNNSHMFPINADDADLIKQFETLNGITINIFYLDQEAYSIKHGRKRLDQLWAAKYMTERKAKDIRINTHLDLLLIREIIPGESIPPVYNSHFVFLLDAIELGTNQRGRNPHTLQCIKCKEYFNGRSLESSNKMLSLHLENDECVERTVKYKIPHDRELKYKHYYTAYAKEFIIYADFEAINKKLIQDFVDTDEFNFENNKQITQHEIIAARYLIMVNDSHLNPREDHPMFGKSYEFKGRDDKTVLQAFIKSLIDTCNELSKELNAKIDYSNLSNEEKHKLNQQTKCFVCGNTFKDYKDKHLHHDHQIEKNNVIAYACQRCNTQMTEKRRAGIPVIFHNGSHYDWKFLMQEVGSIIEKEYPDQQNIDLTNKQSIENVEVLGLNSENYITIKWNNMWFLDSFKFMSSSLSALVKTLTKDDLELAKKLYKLNGIKEEEVSILSQKNIFPYIWFDSYDKFSEKALPERKYFESNDDYEYALKAWDILKCKTFEDYHDMYLIADVVLLATCFHAFRKNIYNMHKTDPAYFLGLPGLSWSIAMKHLPKGKAIELLEKPEHYLMFQNSLQGGICQVFQRYAKKRDATKGQDATQILYLDVNGLYAHIMANMKLPYKLVDYNLDTKESYSYSKIKELCEDEEHTYFFIIDATISELMIERNPALKYLPFFPVKINEKEIQKSKWMKVNVINIRFMMWIHISLQLY